MLRAGVAVGAAAWLGSGCGSDTVAEPPLVELPLVYISRLPAGCPDGGSICYSGCAHHNAPAGLQAIVPLWSGETVRLAEAGPGRYEGRLTAVPTGTRLRLYGRDIGMCCVDACSYPPVLEDILLNGTKLTTVVHDRLPEGLTAALEFTVDGGGAIHQ